jgi:TnpA family transposase
MVRHRPGLLVGRAALLPRRRRRDRRHRECRYGRDPIIKLYTHISDRYAPFHVKVITGTSGEAIHVLDGLVNHNSAIDILAHHTDAGGLSDHVFAIMYLLGIRFQPRMSSPNDRRLRIPTEVARDSGMISPTIPI